MDQSILERPPHGITKRLNAEKAAQPSKLAAAEKAARTVGEATACRIYALDDLARRFHRTPFAYLSMCNVIESVRDSIKFHLDTARAMLPKNHPAIEYITKSGDALDSMCKVVYEFYDGADGATMPLKTIGEVMRGFVVKAAQAIEHAELACGQTMPTMGYVERPDSDPCRVSRKRK
jgi:hypothetical protein